MRVLLLSAYDAQSHRRWRRELVRHLADWDWEVLALPPRFFSWRFRGNALSWALGAREVLEGGYDRIVATSMVDLATLRGLVPSLAGIETVVYFHENQFAYPIQHEVVDREVFHFCMLNLYTALAADRVAFNSAYNRDSFLQGVQELCDKMPDHVPAGVRERLAARARVLPVPLEDTCFVAEGERAEQAPDAPLSILWNHRWEYDKAPERFFGALRRLSAQGADFRLHVVGQQFRSKPPSFAQAREQLAGHIATWGYLAEREAYDALLRRCDVVVSTALHEFQGLALLEAVAAGCWPVVPDRLAYRDAIPARYRYASTPDDAQAEEEALCAMLHPLLETPKDVRAAKAIPLDRLRWSSLVSAYQNWISGDQLSSASGGWGPVPDCRTTSRPPD